VPATKMTPAKKGKTVSQGSVFVNSLANSNWVRRDQQKKKRPGGKTKTTRVGGRGGKGKKGGEKGGGGKKGGVWYPFSSNSVLGENLGIIFG